MTKEVNLVAPCNSLGFGIFSVIYYKHLIQENYIVNWDIIGGTDTDAIETITKDYDLDEIKMQEAFNRSLNPDCVTLIIWHPSQIDRCHIGTKRIGITHFETTRLMPEEIAQMSALDEVYVCSKWGEKILKDHGIENSGVCPGICAPAEMDYSDILVECSYARTQITKILGTNHANTTILCSTGKWESRKDQARLVDSLEDIDMEYGPIALVAFWNNIFTGGLKDSLDYLFKANWESECQINSEGSFGHVMKHKEKDITIILMPFVKSQQKLLGFMLSSAIFITASKGEGWDQPLVDAMYLGKLCVATYNTAHEEYLNETNCVIIPCIKEIADDGKWFHGNRGEWFPAIDTKVISQSIDWALKMHSEDKVTMLNDKIEVCEQAANSINKIISRIPSFINSKL
jgi:hypothetical protein